ncbi:MAG: hypothetical protein KO217_07975 [Methanobacteriaceae archaeon]|jgi:hypothetical protein|nr:hypothetical protein [Methanobacteriaceae archaeon]
MRENQRNALLSLIGGIGLLVLLGGLFGLYPFNYGLLGAFVFWIVAGVLKAYYG